MLSDLCHCTHKRPGTRGTATTRVSRHPLYSGSHPSLLGPMTNYRLRSRPTRSLRVNRDSSSSPLHPNPSQRLRRRQLTLGPPTDPQSVYSSSQTPRAYTVTLSWTGQVSPTSGPSSSNSPQPHRPDLVGPAYRTPFALSDLRKFFLSQYQSHLYSETKVSLLPESPYTVLCL